ncbi:MAG: hypothetical protein M0R21_03700 [Lentimicrobiaceae bacterium]|jgi:copper chaperone|nr:hypothetical protein [Lentimicrobiaceae bacterium]
MITLQFKTNLKCGGCVAAITPFLNSDPNIHSWSADINSPDKILLVSGEHLTGEYVIELLKKAGYIAVSV